MRQVVLDTETTGLAPQHGHRITEIGCFEIIDRQPTGRTFQTYLNPEREVDPRAAQITGLTWGKLKDEPKFHEVVDGFITFIDDAELIIHNAPFDLGFLDHELQRVKHKWNHVDEKLDIIDTLILAREMHPGQRNSLDALCKRYSIDNSHRNYHGALLDAEILAHVYLAMTAGQTDLDLSAFETKIESGKQDTIKIEADGLRIVKASAKEHADHEKFLELMQNKE